LGELADAVAGAEQVARDVEIGMQDMFGELAAAAPRSRVRPLAKHHRLEGEKDTLGLYLSGPPIDDYLAELRNFCPARIANLAVGRPRQLLAGWVVNLRITRSKRGDNMAFALLDDQSGRVEISLFADVYEKNREKLAKDSMIVIQGDVQGDEYTGELRVRVAEAFTIVEARARFAHHLQVHLCADLQHPDIAQRLRGLLEPHRSSADDNCRLRVRLNYATASARGHLELPAEWSLQPNDELLRSLRNEFGSERVNYAYET
jgi:DNA polymerase-3 subunit alpha